MSEQPKTELAFSLPIRNPRTGRPSVTFVVGGFIDYTDTLQVIGRRLVDWKTTGSVSQFQAKTTIGFQREIYALGYEATYGELPTEIEYRVIQVPGIRFCSKDKGDWNSYEDRCFTWILSDSKHLGEFARPISQGRLTRCREFLWECSKRILESRRADRWLPNEMACFNYNRECEFLPLCQGLLEDADVDWLIEQDYTRRPSQADLVSLADGKEILSYSALKTLTTCGLKYYWQYERRLKRDRGEDSPAMRIGSVSHCGMEAFVGSGHEAACEAIEKWTRDNPVLGKDAAVRQKIEMYKARAIVRAAMAKWPTWLTRNKIEIECPERK